MTYLLTREIDDYLYSNESDYEPFSWYRMEGYDDDCIETFHKVLIKPRIQGLPPILIDVQDTLPNFSHSTHQTHGHSYCVFTSGGTIDLKSNVPSPKTNTVIPHVCYRTFPLTLQKYVVIF